MNRCIRVFAGLVILISAALGASVATAQDQIWDSDGACADPKLKERAALLGVEPVCGIKLDIKSKRKLKQDKIGRLIKIMIAQADHMERDMLRDVERRLKDFEDQKAGVIDPGEIENIRRNLAEILDQNFEDIEVEHQITTQEYIAKELGVKDIGTAVKQKFVVDVALDLVKIGRGVAGVAFGDVTDARKIGKGAMSICKNIKMLADIYRQDMTQLMVRANTHIDALCANVSETPTPC